MNHLKQYPWYDIYGYNLIIRQTQNINVLVDDQNNKNKMNTRKIKVTTSNRGYSIHWQQCKRPVLAAYRASDSCHREYLVEPIPTVACFHSGPGTLLSKRLPITRLSIHVISQVSEVALIWWIWRPRQACIDPTENGGQFSWKYKSCQNPNLESSHAPCLLNWTLT